MTNIAVWAAMLALTAAEVGLAWVRLAPSATLALLLALSSVKAVLIAWWFMHLRQFRPRVLTMLIPVLLLFIGFLLALLPDGFRAGAMR